MKASALISILEQAGWYQIRQLGNHRIFMHMHHPNLISIPDLGDQALKLGLLNDIFREAGLKCRVHKIQIDPLAFFSVLKNMFRLTR